VLLRSGRETARLRLIYKAGTRKRLAAMVRAGEEEGSKMVAKKYSDGVAGGGRPTGRGWGERTGREATRRLAAGRRRRWKRDRDRRQRSGQTRRTGGGPCALRAALGLLAGRAR
jgi:hypothetical protein